MARLQSQALSGFKGTIAANSVDDDGATLGFQCMVQVLAQKCWRGSWTS